jgi:hypothetical protein
MTAEQANKVSVIDPISPAIERVKVMLFKPFDLGRWFIIGFCAWLAYLGTGGGGGGGGGGPQWHGPHKQHELQSEIAEGVDIAKEYILANLFWIIPTAVIIIAAIICLGLLIAWINSRGRFMFLHCVAENKSEVKVPWHKFRKHGNSLFIFRIVLALAALAIMALPISGIIFFVILITTHIVPLAVSVPGMLLCIITIILLAIVLSLVRKFTFDFVVPIMFLRTEDCVAGWREFLTILSINKARFTLYILFQIVISIIIGTIIFIGACIGCCLCCASILLLVPYIGTVILLPLLIFERAYSLYYLRQFGPRFDVFSM